MSRHVADLPPASDDPDPLALARGFGIAGFAAALLGLAIFFVPFIDLLLTLIGLVLAGRSLHLYRATGTEPGETAWMLAMCALILGVIGLVPGALITYTAAFRT